MFKRLEGDKAQAIGQISKKTRIEMKLTVKELSNISGVSSRTIAKFENGKSNTQLEIINKILESLGLEISIQ